MNIIQRSTLGAASLVISITSFAASPQPGMWGIDSELNGKPGRGLQIDQQNGKTIVVSYYGYRKDGSAVFYQAVGQMQEDGTSVSDLMEYKNGTPLAGPPQSGETENNMGPMLLEFDSTTTGYVTLPGEVRKPISLLTYEDTRSRLHNSFRAINTRMFAYGNDNNKLQNYKISIDGDIIKITIASPSFICDFKGPLIKTGTTFSTETEGQCVAGGGLTIGGKRFTEMHVNSQGQLSMKVRSKHKINDTYIIDVMDGEIRGICVNNLTKLQDISSQTEPCIPVQ